MAKSKTLEERWNNFLNNCNINDFYKNSCKKYWFDCHLCNHNFEISFNKYKNNRWCPYCSIPPKRLCENLNCNLCFIKSFASHSKSIHLNNQNDKNPRQVFKGTRKKYLFNCEICNHIFNISIDAITILNQWCQYCSNQKLCNNTECIKCFNKSFASHKKSKFFNITNNTNPRNIFKSTHTKYDFTCNLCNNVFKISPHKIVGDSNWCSKCKYKTEFKLLEFLKEIYKDNIIHQVNFEWCKNKKYLPFDFLIKSKNTIIELDGIQHFKQVSNWRNPEKNQERDIYKMKCAFENGYRVIRLIQNDVLKNIFDWKTELLNAINSSEQYILICKNNEYDKYKF